MIVTIHQPNLFPWLGFFDKMRQSDLIVLLDNVPYSKRSFQNRVAIKSSNGKQWLTVPVKSKGEFNQTIKDVQIDHGSNWKKNHLKAFQLYYGKSENYHILYPLLEKLYLSDNVEGLTEFTIRGILLIRKLLNIDTPMILASDLQVEGQKSELLSNLVLAVDGKSYLSGPTGKTYLDISTFQSKGLDIHFHEFKEVPYTQRFGEFIGGLSILDYLFNSSDILQEHVEVNI